MAQKSDYARPLRQIETFRSFEEGLKLDKSARGQIKKKKKKLKARGFDRVLVIISGWPHLGYDRQHPVSLPPP